MLRVAAASLALFAGSYAANDLPSFPTEWSGVIMMRMPYIPLEMPLRVLTTSKLQKVEYYDGLQVDLSSAEGTFKYVFNNSQRVCMFSPPMSGPTVGEGLQQAAPAAWTPLPFFPDLSQYKRVDDELVGGILCQKYTLDAQHGTVGTMDDHMSFFWDPVLGKPVRWHMHSRHVTFGSHTDEYIMDVMSFQAVAPSTSEMQMPAACQKPHVASASMPLRHFLEAARAPRAPAAAGAGSQLLFESYMQQHGKSYPGEEMALRFGIFEKNVRLIGAMNERHSGKASFRGNQFLDMTREEVLSFRGGNSGGSRQARRTEEHRQLVRSFEATVSTELPSDFDWRVARPGSVSPVKDQAMCGSCWTYGLTEPIESILAIKTGRMVELPEQFVLDCTWATYNSGCSGGNSDVGALEIIRKYGGVVPTAKAYGSYLSVNGYCKDIRLMEVGAKLTGWVDIKDRDEEGLLQALVREGPISVGIQVPDEMLFYDGGVLKVDSCKNKDDEIDHAVTLVGFGTDEHGTKYYTIRNSWSTYWGDQGYIKIARGETDCCVSCQAGYPEMDVVGAAAAMVV